MDNFFLKLIGILLGIFVIFLLYSMFMLDAGLKVCNEKVLEKDKLITDLTVKGLNKELGQ